MDHDRLIEIAHAWDAVVAAGGARSFDGFEVGFFLLLAVALLGLLECCSTGIRSMGAIITLVTGVIGAGSVLRAAQHDPGVVKLAAFRASYCSELSVAPSTSADAVALAKNANCPRHSDPSDDSGLDLLSIVVISLS